MLHQRAERAVYQPFRQDVIPEQQINKTSPNKFAKSKE
jgi:hypothetical protein